MKHGRVNRWIADSIAEERRVWVYVNPPESEREGAVEVVGYSVEIGMWVMIILVGDGLLFNGFVLDRDEYYDEVREFMDKIGQGF